MAIDTEATRPLMEHADVVIVGMEAPVGMANVASLLTLPPADDSSVDSPLMNAQPKQLWIFASHSEFATDDRCARLADLGVRCERVTTAEEALQAIAAHTATLLDLQRASQQEMARELVTLRRELNRALSALSADHPILGLLTTRSLVEHHAEPLGVVMVPFGSNNGLSSSAATLEIQRLQDAIATMEGTKVMRWSRAPRRLYARLRSK